MDVAANATAAAATAVALSSFDLDNDIVGGGEVTHAAGTTIHIRKPGAGEFRGLQLLAVSQLDYNSIEILAPRITTPVLAKAHVAAMDPADLMQLGDRVMDFLLPKAAKPASLPA